MPIDIPGTGISGFLHEAPTDGKLYGRQLENWAPAVEDAPADSTGYFRRNEQWVVNPLQTDAIDDGKNYARINGNWVENPVQQIKILLKYTNLNY